MSLMWVERMVLPPARCMCCGSGFGRAAYFGEDDDDPNRILHLFLCESCIFGLPVQMATHPDFGQAITRTVVDKADLAELDRLLTEAKADAKDARERCDAAEDFARKALAYQQGHPSVVEEPQPPAPVKAKAR